MSGACQDKRKFWYGHIGADSKFLRSFIFLCQAETMAQEKNFLFFREKSAAELERLKVR